MTRLRALRTGVRIPAGSRNFSLLQNVQNSFEAHRAPYLMARGGGLSAGVKRVKRDADNLLSSSAMVQNEWSCTFTFPVYRITTE